MADQVRVSVGGQARSALLTTGPTDSSGNPIGGAAANPSFERTVGAPNLATAQAVTSVSPATSLIIVAARAGRQSVTITNITGTQPVYLKSVADATGATTGYFLAGAPGAAITLSYTGALYGTSPTAAQTVSVAETY